MLEAATGEDFSDLRYFRRRGTKIAGTAVDVSRTGYTGDLGYELWIPADAAPAVWDALFDVGQAYAIRPAGMLALDVTRLEAGLILLEVDYTSRPPRDEPGAELQPVRGRPGQARELRQGGLRRQAGRSRRSRPQAVPPGASSGSSSTGTTSSGCTTSRACRPRSPRRSDRSPIPVFDGNRQVGKATSHGWSPILKQAIALASVPPRYDRTGTRLGVEWTVEGRRGRVNATVVELPFLDLPRKRA